MESTHKAVLTPRGVTVYDHLCDRLRADLLALGKPGERIPGEKALALQFGVAPVTMSRALQELQRDGFLLRIPGKGTFLTAAVSEVTPPAALEEPVYTEPGAELGPHLPAEGMRAVIFAPLGAQPELAQLFRNWEPAATSRVERALQRAGGKTILLNTDIVAPDEVGGLIQELRDGGSNCALFSIDVRLPQFTEWHRALMTWQEESGAALVQLRMSPDLDNFDSVGFDDIEGAVLIGRHLRSLGHRRIVYVVPDGDHAFVKRRFTGLKRAFLTESGASVDLIQISVPAEILHKYPTQPSGYDIWKAAGEAAGPILADGHDYTAIVLANDQMAMVCIEQMKMHGKKVPQDFSVVGYDDRLISGPLGLTTVHVPVEAMADEATRMLIRRYQGSPPDYYTHVAVKPQLVERLSTRASNA